jgi:acetylornithine deacetylase/succinyl-diaminopimelate desuccinylase-like protein
MNSSQIFQQHFDRSYLTERLCQLARVPTDVPLGFDTLIEPDDPKLVHYVQEVLRPELVRIGIDDLLDAPRNNLVVRRGSDQSGRALLIQNYTPSQHHNLMKEPLSGKLASAERYGIKETAVFGQGVSQAKAHQAVMLTVLKAINESGVMLRGRLYWAINNEGRSSHACTEAILGVLDQKPDFGIIQIGTGLKLWLGNRGRVDIDIHVQGKVAHSSSPQEGLSALEASNEIFNRLKTLTWPDRHPLLGGRHAVIYKVRYEPMAPHTLPSDAYITVDRRLLPGDDPDTATDEIRNVIGDLSPYRVMVERGVYMLPALVDPEHPGVKALRSAHESVVKNELETVYGQGSFDAGGLCKHGVPAIMYGASGGDWPTGDDFVPVSAVETEARVLWEVILDQLS